MAKYWERTEERGVYRRINRVTGEVYPNLYVRFEVRGKERSVATPATKVRDAAAMRKKLVRAAKEQPYLDLDKLLHGEVSPITSKGPTISMLLERYLVEASIASKKQNKNAVINVLRRAGIVSPEDAPWTVLCADTVAAYKRRVEQEAGRDPKEPEKVNFLRRAHELRSAKSVLGHARSVFAQHLRPSYRELGMEDITGFFEGDIAAPTVSYEIPPRALLENIAAKYPELEQSDPGAYVGFLIGLGCGLRNKEAAGAKFDWLEAGENGATWLRLTTQVDSRTKNAKTRWIEVPQTVFDAVTRLRGVVMHSTTGMRTAKGAPPRTVLSTVVADREYLIPGTSPTDRYNAITRRLADWLRGHGLDHERYPKAYYELRKLLGSLIARRDKSVFRAAQVLGNLPTTAEKYYVGAMHGPAPLDILNKPATG